MKTTARRTPFTMSWKLWEQELPSAKTRRHFCAGKCSNGVASMAASFDGRYPCSSRGGYRASNADQGQAGDGGNRED